MTEPVPTELRNIADWLDNIADVQAEEPNWEGIQECATIIRVQADRVENDQT